MFNNSQDKTFKYLVLGAIAVVALVLVYNLFLRSKPLNLPDLSSPYPSISINPNLFQNQEIEEMLPFKEASLPKALGRENPFEPY